MEKAGADARIHSAPEERDGPGNRRGNSMTLTPRQKWLIKQSFESIEGYSYSLTKLFYGRLFERRPDLRSLFKVSLEDQSRKLLDMIVIIVEALDDFEALRPRLAELGRKHVT